MYTWRHDQPENWQGPSLIDMGIITAVFGTGLYFYLISVFNSNEKINDAA